MILSFKEEEYYEFRHRATQKELKLKIVDKTYKKWVDEQKNEYYIHDLIFIDKYGDKWHF